MCINKRWNVKMVILIFMGMLLCFVPLNCLAKEQSIPEGTLVEAVTDALIKEDPQISAPDVVTVIAGTAMFTVGEEDNGWYKVKIKEKEGYIQKEEIVVFNSKI